MKTYRKLLRLQSVEGSGGRCSPECCEDMLLGTQNHCGANLANSKGATDFSIAAIMARGPSSREPSERSISKFTRNCSITYSLRSKSLILYSKLWINRSMAKIKPYPENFDRILRYSMVSIWYRVLTSVFCTFIFFKKLITKDWMTSYSIFRHLSLKFLREARPV